MMVLAKEAPANYVPAAAVIHRVQALSGFTGRKERVGGGVSQTSNTLGLTRVRVWDCFARDWERKVELTV